MTSLQYRMHGNKTTIFATCFICGKQTQLEVRTKDFENYARGMYVQDAFPNMSVDDRETIISGMCKECQDKFFNTDEEEEIA